jgi:hypothetical protein
VIVAGGRLIATRRIDPSTLTTLEEFRSTIFGRLLDEMDLRGPKFAIDPPLPVLHLLAALGPVDVEQHGFQQSAQALFARPTDEILATVLGVERYRYTTAEAGSRSSRRAFGLSA